MKLNIISLFAGSGGLDLGFKKSGFNIVWANEYDKKIIPTFKHNFKRVNLDERSISEININEIPECDGIIGGPPCQSWSAAGSHRGINDARGKLFLEEYIEIVRSKKPKFFLAENVPGIEYKKHQSSLHLILENLRNIGYNISYSVFNTHDYGVAQTRKRLIIVGYASGFDSFFELDKYSGKKLTLKDVIYDLKDNAQPALKGNKPNLNCKFLNHEYNNTPRDKNSFHYMSRNRVRSWEEPSFTIPATGRFVPQHPNAPKMIPLLDKNGKKIINVMKFKPGYLRKYRRLSVRECARIQGFPDDFEFLYDNVDDGYKMIGNAVPVNFAWLIAKKIKRDMSKFHNIKPTFRKKGKILKI